MSEASEASEASTTPATMQEVTSSDTNGTTCYFIVKCLITKNADDGAEKFNVNIQKLSTINELMEPNEYNKLIDKFHAAPATNNVVSDILITQLNQEHFGASGEVKGGRRKRSATRRRSRRSSRASRMMPPLLYNYI